MGKHYTTSRKQTEILFTRYCDNNDREYRNHMTKYRNNIQKRQKRQSTRTRKLKNGTVELWWRKDRIIYLNVVQQIFEKGDKRSGNK